MFSQAKIDLWEKATIVGSNMSMERNQNQNSDVLCYHMDENLGLIQNIYTTKSKLSKCGSTEEC